MNICFDKDNRAWATPSNPYRHDWQGIFCVGMEVGVWEKCTECGNVVSFSIEHSPDEDGSDGTSDPRALASVFWHLLTIPQSFTDSPSLSKPNNQEHYSKALILRHLGEENMGKSGWKSGDAASGWKPGRLCVAACLTALLALLMGLTRPAADLSRGTNSEEIVCMAALVGLQAIEYRKLYPESAE